MFVKICGTTSEEDALLAVAMGADAVGFVFAPSPRQVQPSLVADIAKRLPPEILTVGVFRNELPERVVDICTFAGLKAAQLHGREQPEQSRWVAQSAAVGHPGGSRPAMPRWRERRRVRRRLHPASTTRRPARARCSTGSWPGRCRPAPGSSSRAASPPANVGRAVAAVQPWAVDAVNRRREGARPQGPGEAAEPSSAAARREAGSSRWGSACSRALDTRDDRPFDWQVEHGPVTIAGVAMGEPSADGRFGEFGGRYIPESLIPACEQLEAAFRAAWADPAFHARLRRCCRTTAGAPRRSPSAPGSRRASAFGYSSSARTSTTPGPTRSTT